MKTEPRIKIRRFRNRWHVRCDVCAGDLPGVFTWPLGPWITALNHQTAIVLAAWHAEEHASRTCESCHRTDPLPKPEHVDSAHVNFDGRLYEIRSTGVVAIGTAATKESA